MSLIPWRDPRGQVSTFKICVLVALCLPGLVTIGIAFTGGFEQTLLASLIYYSGIFSLWALLACLAVTPLSRLFQWRRLVWVRRMLGVGALMYALLHVFAYVAIRRLDVSSMVAEIMGRWSIGLATVSLLGLLALGITSTDTSIQRWGARRWKRLQRTVFIWAPLGLLHFLLSPLAVGPLPFLMFGCLFWLLSWRLLSLKRAQSALSSRTIFWLALATALCTAGFEIFWLDWFQSLPPALIARANFELDLGLSAMWSSLLMGCAVWGLIRFKSRLACSKV